MRNNNNKKSEYPCICFKKWICKLFPQKRIPRPDGTLSEFYQIFNPLKPLKKYRREVITSQFILQDKDNYNTKTLTKGITKKKKIIKQYPSWIQTPKFLTKKQIKFNNISHTKFYPRNAGWLNFQKCINLLFLLLSLW